MLAAFSAPSTAENDSHIIVSATASSSGIGSDSGATGTDEERLAVTPRPYSSSPLSSSSSFDDEIIGGACSAGDLLMTSSVVSVSSTSPVASVAVPPLLHSTIGHTDFMFNGMDDYYGIGRATSPVNVRVDGPFVGTDLGFLSDDMDFDIDAALSYEDGADLLTQLHRAKTCVEVLRRHLAVERDKVATLTRAVEEERANGKKLRAAVAKERDLKREYLAELQGYRNGGVPSGRTSGGGSNLGTGGPERTGGVTAGARRSAVYRSTASLHSDGRSCNSSSGGSTGPSPSPSRFNHQHHYYSPNQQQAGRNPNTTPTSTSRQRQSSAGRLSGSTAAGTPGAGRRPSAPGLSPGTPGSRLSHPAHQQRGGGSSGGLLTPASKKWSSSSDFRSPLSGSVTSINGSISGMSARRTPSGSMMSLARPRRTSAHGTPPSPHGVKSASLRYHSLRDVAFNEEDGSVRFYLRGRPITVYVPTSETEEGFDVSRPIPAPEKSLKLDWVYGYRGKDCRSNLYLLPTGEFVYFVAAVAVLHNVEEMTQRHYLGHTDDIKCMALHPNKLLVATGQCAGHDRKDARSWKLNPPEDSGAPEAEQWPHVRIWDSVNLQTLHVIGIGEFERSVACLSFSGADGGSMLCAVDEAPDHNISIWDWQRGERGHKLVETKCSADRVLEAEFHPVDKNMIVTCGKNHCAFWTLEPNGTLSKRNGLFERDKPKYVTCLAFDDNGNVVTGDSNGNIIVWARGGNTIEKIHRGAHEGGVFSICFMQNGSYVSGGGKDGVLREWDSNTHELTGRELEVPEPFGPVRTITSGKGGSVVVGTTRNAIVRGIIGDDGAAVESLVVGHTDEVWALAGNPHQGQFLTGAHDKILRMWDSMARAVVWTKDMEDGVQSACFSPDGSVIVVGLVSGRWIAMDAETREPRGGGKDGEEPIQVVSFSPDGSLLALGSRDNFIYIYEVADDFSKFSRMGRCSGHSSFISHLDWSEDGVNLQTTSGDYELLYWNAKVCRQIPQSTQLRDVKWASQSCVLGSSVLGIWPQGADGTDVNACGRSRSGDMLAVGDDFGRVRLFRHPASSIKASANSANGHSSHVSGVTFLVDDSRLISIGGRDMSVMQWLLE